METSAIVASLTSVLAIGLSIVLVRLLRQDRQRSDARVTMLAALANAPSGDLTTTPVEAPLLRLEPRATARSKPARPAPRPVAPAMRSVAAEIEIFRDGAFGSAPLGNTGTAPELFEPAPPRSRNPLLYVFMAAIVMAALIVFASGWARPSAGDATHETTGAVSAPAAAEPLSLVSLRHEQHSDGTLVISGVVRNPAGSAARERLFASASLLDAAGALIATARAPLDFTTLAPGDESPFVVRVTGGGGVARYRVSFRDAAGASVAHADKR
ncbi:MAG: FxLYD domain-containing protein [Acidobacteriota bacterium]|nr:FxLYD domain-containing protein [Acidobacteriota bacterium]